MQFKLPLTILASLALAQAFTLPADAQDGAYLVQTDESGQETAVYLGTGDIGTSGKRTEARAELEARDQSGVSTQFPNETL